MLAWMTADKHHIADEIEATADRLGVNLHDCSFSIIQEGSATPQTPAQYQTARKQLVGPRGCTVCCRHMHTYCNIGVGC